VIEPGGVFFMNEDSAPRNTVRLGYTSIRADRIEPGIARLAQVAQRMRLRGAA